ncbi:MAG TPA: hypothetical protein VFD38_11555 [Myxococcaceae bacterium]|nr:hypothetical protein [Myxococcaceae bacterium]
MKPSDSEPAEALRRAQQALTAGDVLTARRLAGQALETHPREKEAAEARDLLTRTDAAWPLVAYGAVAAICFLLLVLVAVLRSAPT